MLRRRKTFKRVFLIGSTSDIGLEILKQLTYQEDAEIIAVGRTPPDKSIIFDLRAKLSFFKCDLENFDDLRMFSKNLLLNLEDIDLAIVAAGYLPPENDELNLELVHKSISINGVGVACILSMLVKRMIYQKKGHILFLSTVASIRPRLRNFTYGASKSCADFFALGLSNKYKKSSIRISILRPGFVYTKMSKNFSPAPFAIESQSVARLAIKGINKNKRIIYAPKILRYVFLFVRNLPNTLFLKIDQGV